jgi:hypothetical protein
MSLREELALYLKEDQLSLIGLIKSGDEEFERLKRVSVDLAITTLWARLEKEFRDLSHSGYKYSASKFVTPRSEFIISFFQILIDNGFVDEVTVDDLKILQDTKNRIWHGIFDVDQVDALKILDRSYDVALAALKGIETANKAGFFDSYDWDRLF